MIKTGEAKGLILLALIVINIGAIPLLLRAFIYSVSIPLFFVSCGYERAERADLLEVKNNSWRILFGWGITALCSFGYSFAGKREIRPAEMLGDIGPLWIVLALSVVPCVYELICATMRRVSVFFVILPAGALAVAGVLLGCKKIYLPFGADIMLVALLFVCFGDMLRRMEDKVWKNKVVWGLLLFAVWAVFVYFGRWMELPIRAYRGNVFCFVSSCAGCVCILYATMLPKQWKSAKALLSWCGERSVLFLCVMGFMQFNVPWTDLYAYIPVTWAEDALVRVCMTVFIVFCIDVWKEKLIALNCA